MPEAADSRSFCLGLEAFVLVSGFFAALSAGGGYAFPAWSEELFKQYPLSSSTGKEWTEKEKEECRTLIFSLAILGMNNPFSGYLIEKTGTVASLLVSISLFLISTCGLLFLWYSKTGLPYGFGLFLGIEEMASVTFFYTIFFGVLELFSSVHHAKISALLLAGFGGSSVVLCQILAVWPKPRIPGFRVFYRCNLLVWSITCTALITRAKVLSRISASGSRGTKKSLITGVVEVPTELLSSVVLAKPPLWKVLLCAVVGPFVYVLMGNLTQVLTAKSPWTGMEKDAASSSLSNALTFACLCNLGGRIMCGAVIDRLPKKLHTVIISLGMIAIGFLVLTLASGYVLYCGVMSLYCGFAAWMVSFIVVVQEASGGTAVSLMCAFMGALATALGYLKGFMAMNWTTYLVIGACVVTCCAPLTVYLCRCIESGDASDVNVCLSDGDVQLSAISEGSLNSTSTSVANQPAT